MHQPARRLSLLSALVAAVTLVTASLAPGAQARAQGLYNQPKYAAIVVDAGTGEVLYARRADQPRYPASITKIMTLYLVFEALATGRLSLTDQVVLSTINGTVNVTFSEISKDKPTSIASINGEIDVTLPAKSAVNLEMRNFQGGMYSDFDFPTDDKQMKKVGGGTVNARLNGGGVGLKMTNINGNIYLRKK